MAAPALALRLPAAARRRASARDARCGLAFNRLGGPLVAVCGLAGGAGTTTLSWQLAHQAAREAGTPVLACEAEALAGGLADLAGGASPIALGQLAGQLAAGERPPAAPFAVLAGGPRLLAGAPSRASNPPPGALERLLSDARAAHGLVVCDCRTLDHPASAELLACATHILWVLAATPAAVDRARALIGAGGLPPSGRAREALAAVVTQPAARASARSLRALAARHERLILVPHTPDPAAASAAGRRVATLTQLATFLRAPC